MKQVQQQYSTKAIAKILQEWPVVLVRSLFKFPPMESLSTQSYRLMIATLSILAASTIAPEAIAVSESSSQGDKPQNIPSLEWVTKDTFNPVKTNESANPVWEHSFKDNLTQQKQQTPKTEQWQEELKTSISNDNVNSQISLPIESTPSQSSKGALSPQLKSTDVEKSAKPAAAPEQSSQISPEFVREASAVIESSPMEIAQAASFPDVQGHWAEAFINALAARNIIVGFPDNTFRPDAPVTRAQYAALISKAFNKQAVRESVDFVDVSQTFWAYEAIQEAYTMGFMAGYPNQQFNPDQQIPRVQALVALASGLNLELDNSVTEVLNTYYRDAEAIPAYAQDQIAAATANEIVVSYPNPNFLNPNQITTRADVAAFMYQALVDLGALPPLSTATAGSQYIVARQEEEPVVEEPTEPTEPTEPQFTPEQIAALREDLLIEPLIGPEIIDILRPAPGATFGVPSAYGAAWGEGYAHLTYANQEGDDDGSLGLGLGFGDPRDSIGVEVGVGIISLTDDFGDRGVVGFKVHRLLDSKTGVAVGWSNPIKWGVGEPDETIYAVLSRRFHLRPNNITNPLPLTATVGAGTGVFRSLGAIDADDNVPNVFGSLALQIVPQASVISSWTGNQLNIGASFVPFDYPLVLSIGGTDMTDNRDNGGPNFVFSAGYLFDF